jgi:hypothetical protein
LQKNLSKAKKTKESDDVDGMADKKKIFLFNLSLTKNSMCRKTGKTALALWHIMSSPMWKMDRETTAMKRGSTWTMADKKTLGCYVFQRKTSKACKAGST